MSLPVHYEAIFARLGGVRPKQGCTNYWYAKCPAHDDRAPSLTLRVADDDGRLLVKCHAGCGFPAIVRALGVRPGAFFPDDDRPHVQPLRGRPEAVYSYHDADGVLLYQVLRFAVDARTGKKTFRQRRPDDRGEWIWEATSVTKVLYRLAEIHKAKAASSIPRIIVVEGEKAVDAIRRLGLVATTCSGGAGKAHLCDWSPLEGCEVAVFADNDEPGRKHAHDVCKLALAARAHDVKWILLPDLEEHAGLDDWAAMEPRPRWPPYILRDEICRVIDYAPSYDRCFAILEAAELERQAEGEPLTNLEDWRLQVAALAEQFHAAGRAEMLDSAMALAATLRRGAEQFLGVRS